MSEKDEGTQKSLMHDASTLLMFSKVKEKSSTDTPNDTFESNKSGQTGQKEITVDHKHDESESQQINSFLTSKDANAKIENNMEQKEETESKEKNMDNIESGKHNELSGNVHSANINDINVKVKHEKKTNQMETNEITVTKDGIAEREVEKKDKTNDESKLDDLSTNNLSTAKSTNNKTEETNNLGEEFTKKNKAEDAPMIRNTLAETDLHVEDLKDKSKDREFLNDHPESKYGEEKEWPVPDSYIVDPDAGTITCICGFTEDDGFTIQCDHCNRWQHAICFNMTHIDHVPDCFICSVCQPRDVNVKLARQIQKRQLSKYANNVDYLDKDLSIQPAKKKRRSNSNENNNNGITVNDKNGFHDENGSGSSDNAGYRNPKSETPPMHRLLKKKEHLISAKEAYHAIYIQTKTSSYKDPLIELFLKKHSNEEFVVQYNEKNFKTTPIEVKPYSELAYSRIFPGFDKLGVFTKNSIFKGNLICEILGELEFKSSYLKDCSNRYRIWGAPKKNVLFHKQWPLVIDQRNVGNDTRYLRKSCNPNVELTTIRLPDDNIRFVYRALRDIEEGEELHSDWQWAKNHPILKIIDGFTTFEEMPNEEKAVLLESIDAILSCCECACGNSNKVCHLIKVKKLIISLCKNVKSKINNRYKLNEILSQYKSKVERREPPILDRFNRETRVLQDLDINDLIYSVNDSSSIKLNPKRSKIVLKSNGLKKCFNNLKVAILMGQKNLENFNNNIPKNKNDLDLTSLDEKNISDLNKLPIPIAFPLDIFECTDDASNPASSTNVSRTNSGTNIANVIAASELSNVDEKTKANSIQTGIHINQIEISVPKTDNTSEEQNKSKKKLSFADYRKTKTNK